MSPKMLDIAVENISLLWKQTYNSPEWQFVERDNWTPFLHLAGMAFKVKWTLQNGPPQGYLRTAWLITEHLHGLGWKILYRLSSPTPLQWSSSTWSPVLFHNFFFIPAHTTFAYPYNEHLHFLFCALRTVFLLLPFLLASKPSSRNDLDKRNNMYLITFLL